MLHILLFILKLVGILLLIIFGIFLIVIFSVLFVPVRYQLDIQKQEHISMYIRATWFFRVFRLNYQLQNGEIKKENFIVRFFGIPIVQPSNKKNKKERKAERKKHNRKKQKEKTVKEKSTENKTKTDEIKTDKTKTNKKIEKASKAKIENKEIKKEKVSNPSETKKKAVEKKAGIFQRIWKHIQKIPKFFHGIKDKKERLFEFWNKEEHRLARNAIYKIFRYLWKKSKPKKIKGRLHFGLEDPCDTGLLLGILSIIQNQYKNEISLEADFEQVALEGRLQIKGRLLIYTFLRSFFSIYFDKNIRTMYYNWNKI